MTGAPTPAQLALDRARQFAEDLVERAAAAEAQAREHWRDRDALPVAPSAEELELARVFLALLDAARASRVMARAVEVALERRLRG